MVQGARALGDMLNEKLRKSFQMFKALRFIDEKNSFRENELITDVIICFAPIKEQICKMIFRQDSDIRVYNFVRIGSLKVHDPLPTLNILLAPR